MKKLGVCISQGSNGDTDDINYSMHSKVIGVLIKVMD